MNTKIMQRTDPTLLLQECRQIMTKRMRNSITAMLNEVDDNLLKMAQNHTGDMEESECYEAIREIRLKRVEIKTRFERRFINLFNNELQVLTRGKRSNRTNEQYTSTTESVQGDVAAMDNSLGKVGRSCNQVLLELDGKISALLESEARANPMQPAFVFEAFRDACWDIKSGNEVRLMMFKIFEKHIAEELQGIYSDINSLLAGEDKMVEYAVPGRKVSPTPPVDDNDSVLLRYEVINRIEGRLALAGHEAPEFARQFLLKYWRQFLEHIYLKYTENSIAWNAARQTMDDLIWITRKPVNLYDRQRQVQLLPSLLFRLLNGMKVIAMSDASIDRFLKQLKEHQLKSLDFNDGELLDSITQEARENAGKNQNKVMH